MDRTILPGGRYDSRYMQTGVAGRTLAADIPTGVHELRSVARGVKVVFDEELSRIATTCRMQKLAMDDLAAAGFRGLVLAPLKGDNDKCKRCIDKCLHKYQPEIDKGMRDGPAVAWLIDVVRCSFVCAEPVEIRRVLKTIDESKVLEVVRVKVNCAACVYV